MNIVFMGTPDFAVPSLSRIFNSNHKVLAVVTAPDKERGRGQKVSYTPVKEFALLKNIPFLQPVRLKDPAFAEELKKINADLFVIVAFRILPKEIFTIPTKGSFNLHASLLPKYRGAAPLQWSIINGDKETGVTTFALQEVVDTGNIYLQRKTVIDDEDNFGTLHDRLSIIGSDTVLDTINIIERGSYKLIPQTDEHASAAPKITKETGFIDWNKDSVEIHNLVRGLSPYPGAYFFNNNKMMKIYKSLPVEQNILLKPGEIVQEKAHLIVGCGKNALSILEIQQEGRKKMNITDFLRGYSFNP